MDSYLANNYIYILAVAILIFLLILVLAARHRQAARPPRQDPYVEALKKMLDQDSKTAFTLLQQAVKRGNAPTDAYIRLGELLRENGQPIKALQIHQSLTVKSNLGRAEKMELSKNIAQDYARLGKADRAAEVLESALRSSHLKQANILLLLSGLYQKLGQIDKAYETLRELKHLEQVDDRKIALFLATAGEKNLAGGDFRTARKYLQKAIKHDPACPTALFVLGDLEEKSDRGDEAIGSWKQAALASEELTGPVLERLQRILFAEGKFGELEQIILDIMNRRNGDEAATMALALFYQKQGRDDDALQLLEEFDALDRQSLGAAVLLTFLYARHSDNDILKSFISRAVNRGTAVRNYVCRSCDHRESVMRWHCPECNAFDSFTSTHAD
jgi:lipopolysaccharide biosynthesis regulator YciM